MVNEYYSVFLKTLSSQHCDEVAVILKANLSIESRLEYLEEHLSLKGLQICKKLMELQEIVDSDKSEVKSYEYDGLGVEKKTGSTEKLSEDVSDKEQSAERKILEKEDEIEEDKPSREEEKQQEAPESLVCLDPTVMQLKEEIRTNQTVIKELLENIEGMKLVIESDKESCRLTLINNETILSELLDNKEAALIKLQNELAIAEEMVIEKNEIIFQLNSEIENKSKRITDVLERLAGIQKDLFSVKNRTSEETEEAVDSHSNQ